MTNRIIIDAAARDLDECPDCDVELEGGFGEMGEQKECPECGERYVIDEVAYLRRVDVEGERSLADALDAETSEAIKRRHERLKESTGDDTIDWDAVLNEYEERHSMGEEIEQAARELAEATGGNVETIRKEFEAVAEMNESEEAIQFSDDYSEGRSIEEFREELLGNRPEVGDKYRRQTEYDDIEMATMVVERVVEDTDAGKELYQLVHESENPETELVSAERLAEKYEPVE